jgi:glycosyltransferase involved in cell wall biosynthesis
MNRVAYICADDGVPVFGRKGASVHLQEVVRALDRRGLGVSLFAARVDGPAPREFDSIPLHPLPAPPKGELAAREQAALAANDALHTALKLTGPFSLVYERYSLWSHAGMEYARDCGVPAVLEVNAPLIEEQAAHRGLANRAGAEAVAGRAFNAANVIVCVSEEVAAYVRGLVREPEKVHVVPNGVSPERFGKLPPPALPPNDGTFVLGFVGTLKPWHGLSVLAEAFAQLCAQHGACRLLIVGDGPERQPLERDLAARGLRDAVHFTGAVAPETVPAWLASMHVGVAPYPAMEQFYFSPLKIYEYLAAGLPVVASRIGQCAQVLRHGENSLLVPPGDAEALGAALERLRADAPLRASLGANGRAQALKQHTWDAVVKRVLDLASAHGRPLAVY